MQGFWDTEVVEETRAEETRVEEPAVPPAPAAVEEPASVALSEDEFSALEERILRAVNLVKRERLERARAEQQAAEAEARAAELAPRMAALEGEVAGLRAERGQMRQRVERLLEQLDALEL